MRSLSLVFVGLASAFFLASAACGSSSSGRDTFGDDDDADAATSSGGGGGGSNGNVIGGGDGGGGGTSSGGSQSGCSDAAKLVYVLSGDYDLYSFDPAALKFEKIGRIDCAVEHDKVTIDDGSGDDIEVSDNTPNSMAVDRTGRAWVGYQDGELFNVDTSNAHCTSTGFDYANSGFNKYGMGFSADSAGATTDTLYLIGEQFEVDGQSLGSVGKGLYKLDTTSFALTAVGDFPGHLRHQAGELTGGGDGKLYGFFTTSPAVSAEIDKSSAVTSNEKKLDTVDLSGGSYAFAFSYWGGDFWFYSSKNGNPSKVTRLRTSTNGKEETAVANVGDFQIVGAGVSTCAPTTSVVN